MSTDMALEQMSFDPPGPGTWTLDSAHVPRTWSRYQIEVAPLPVADGIRESFRRYGALIDTVQYRPVNGLAYFTVVPAPESELAARMQRADEVFERKLWREDMARWEQVVKPASISAHLALQAVDPASLGTDELLAHLDQCREHQKRMFRQHHALDCAALLPVGDFMVHVAEWTGRPLGEFLALTRGYAPESAGSLTALDRLVTAIRRSPDGQAAVAPEISAEDAVERLRSAAGELGAAAAAYLELVGYRLLDSMDAADPYALEVPQVLIEGIRLALRNGTPVSNDASAQEVARLRDLVPAAHRDEFDALLAEARLTSSVRDERGLYSDAWASGITRRALLAAGARLTAGGRLHEPAHLIEGNYAEIRSLIAGMDGPSASELAQRARHRATYDASTAPAFLGAPPQAPPPLDGLPAAAARVMRAIGTALDALFAHSEAASEPTVVRGTSASPGCYEGTARLISGPAEFSHLAPGDVLVTATTTDSFNLVLPLVGAIVTDRGGLLSHAAIVSRECGIPAVVGCQDATALIADGARVRVDGTKGEIVVLTP